MQHHEHPPPESSLALHHLRSLPKAEVHVHLEGAISLAQLLEAARESGTPLPGPAASLFDISTHSTASGGDTALSAYLAFLRWEGSLFSTRDQVALLAYRFAAHQSASGILWTDVIVNPAHWTGWSTRVGELFDALGAGFAQAAQDGLGAVGVCASLERRASASSAQELVDLLVHRAPEALVGLSIDGDESVTGRTSARFAAAFETARRAGLRRTVHAGESSGPEGVTDALDLLHAERIDHGVRAVEDRQLMDRLADLGTPLGVCLTSNLALGLYPDLATHPLTTLDQHGVQITVNTDDPQALGTRLEVEWALAATAHGWDRGRVLALAHASFSASFAPAEAQRDGHRAIDAWARANGWTA